MLSKGATPEDIIYSYNKKAENNGVKLSDTELTQIKSAITKATSNVVGE